MPTISVTKRFAGGSGRSMQAAVVAVAACALLLIVALGTWQARRQAAIAADAAAALAQLRGQQAEIQSLARQLAELRNADELLRAQVTKLDGGLAEPAVPTAAEQPIAPPPLPAFARSPGLVKPPVPARPVAPARPPMLAGSHEPAGPVPTEASFPIPPVPEVGEDEPARRAVVHRASHLKRKAKTVVVDGVTYVRGREPHALALPTE